MKKPYENTVLSSRACVRCGRRIKLNVLVRRPDSDLCYKCWRKSRGKKPR